MKFDRIIESMVPGDVEIVMSCVIRDHLGCECVDHTDKDATADHLAELVVETLQYDPKMDDVADYVLGEGK